MESGILAMNDQQDIVIELKDVSFEYPLTCSIDSAAKEENQETSDIGGQLVSRRGRCFVRALNHVDLTIRRGERIGIVGRNGAGKSTLLRLMAGIYKPSGGQLNMYGESICVITPSAGMDFELSVRENIYLRGYFLGMSKQRIDDQIDAILEWSELGPFEFLPLHTLSPGMSTRLAFAISTAFSTDILLLDEWMGAGDAQFMEKAHQRMQDLVNETATFVLCSHNEFIINENCTRKLTVAKGQIVTDESISS